MYNRYIPQSDGSYRRKVVKEQCDSKPLKPCPRPEPEKPACPCQDVLPPILCAPDSCQNPRSCKKPKECGQNTAPFSFFSKNLDTGDLLIIVLLLLMSADSCEDQSTALLTLALYLFM